MRGFGQRERFLEICGSIPLAYPAAKSRIEKLGRSSARVRSRCLISATSFDFAAATAKQFGWLDLVYGAICEPSGRC